MLQRNLLTILLCGLLTLTACSSATATQTSSVTPRNRIIDAALLQGSNVDDWPMFGHDPAHTSFVDIRMGAVHGKLLWSQKLGPIFSSPVAGLGFLFIASTNGNLYALKQDSGNVVWHSQVGNHLTDATPVLEGQVLFVAVHSSALEALNASTGQVYWTFETQEKIQAPPLVVGQRVFLASRTTVWALDATSGRLSWKFHHGTDGWPTTATPTYMSGTVYIGLGSGSQFWALNASTGKVRWSFDTGDRITSAALATSDMVYVATWHGIIYALNRADGQKRWSYALNGLFDQTVVDGVGGSMALADGHLYTGDYRGSVLCIDSAKGKLVWRYATGAQILATPIIAAELVYTGSSDGYFYAIDIRTGRPVWRYETGEIRGSASLASGHLYVGSITGTMYAFY